MFYAMKRKALNWMLISSLVLNGAFIIENASAYAAMKTGLVQGQVKPPAMSFGGYDAAKEEQIAMLGSALPSVALKPIPDSLPKAFPVPARKPVQK